MNQEYEIIIIKYTSINTSKWDEKYFEIKNKLIILT